MRALIKLLPRFKADRDTLLLGLLIAALATIAGLILAALSGMALMKEFAPQWLLGSVSLILLLRAAGVGRLLLRYIERLMLHNATFRTLARLRLWFFSAATPLAPAGLGLMRGGDLLSRAVSDVNALDGLVLRVIAPLTMLALGLALLGALAFAMMPLAGVLLLVILISAAFITLALGRRTWQAGTAAIEAQAELRTHALDGLTGMAELLAFSQGADQTHTLIAHSSRLAHQQLREKYGIALGLCAIQLGLGIAVATLLALPLGLSLFPLLFLLLSVGELLTATPAIAQQLGRMNAAAGRLEQIATQAPPVPEPTAPVALPTDNTIIFSHIGLTYDRATVLHDVSFTLAPGQQVMLTGPSGAGKSSITNLLLRFIAPTSGTIQLGGVDVTSLRNSDVRSRMAALSQRTRLISGSVRENLQLAAPAADDAALWQALERVALQDVVKALPQGLDTWVGENGLQLSGGQARRLALAQMLLKDAPIWLLDEPTEGLDAATARTLLETLKTLSVGRTLLFITHQPEWGEVLGISQHWQLNKGQFTL